MSLIYSLGDRVLVAGVASRSSIGSMTPLYSDSRSPNGIRIVEAMVNGISSSEPVQGDAPARNAVMFLQYNGTDGSSRNLDYGLWMVGEGNFGTRVRRTLDRIEGLTPEQRELLMFYSYPRVIASVAYTHMLRDLASLVVPNTDVPRIVITDRDVVFARAAELSIPTFPYDMYRGVAATVEEPEDMEVTGSTTLAARRAASDVQYDMDEVNAPPAEMTQMNPVFTEDYGSDPRVSSTGMVISSPTTHARPAPVWDFVSTSNGPESSTVTAVTEPVEDSDDDDDWMEPDADGEENF